ncbi:MAG: anti-phage protein KwaA [Pseudomonadota bacterium]
MTTNRTLEKFELYVISLWLLFLLIIIVTLDIPFCFDYNCEFIGLTNLGKRNIVPLIALFFGLLSAFYYFRFEYKIAGSKSIPVTITSVEDISYEHLAFLTTSIIPLISFNLTSERYLIALGVLLIVIGAIYVKTDKFYVNPTLAILGFRLYSAVVTRRTGTTVKVILITRDRLQNGSQIKFLELDNGVFYAKGRP